MIASAPQYRKLPRRAAAAGREVPIILTTRINAKMQHRIRAVQKYALTCSSPLLRRLLFAQTHYSRVPARHCFRSLLSASHAGCTELRLPHSNRKNPDRNLDPGSWKFYPAGAVQVILPFPFRKGWMTVAAESDFQSRPVIFRTNQASVFRQLSVRGRHLNREHRRANVYIPKTPARESIRSSGRESRWLRVERKALVSCPTLNERLSISKNYSRNSARRSRRNRSRIFACAAVTSSLVSVRLRSRYVNRYASDFRPAPICSVNKSKSSTLSKSGSRGS